MQPYSLDLRQRILADCDKGLTFRAVATRYSASESRVRCLKGRRRESVVAAIHRSLFLDCTCRRA